MYMQTTWSSMKMKRMRDKVRTSWGKEDEEGEGNGSRKEEQLGPMQDGRRLGKEGSGSLGGGEVRKKGGKRESGDD